MSESDSKKLSDLRVVDLKIELEKRGLDKNGVKQVLMDRLQKALVEEGKDPESYLFKPSDEKPADKPTKRLSTTGKGDGDESNTDGGKTKVINEGSEGNIGMKAENGGGDDIDTIQKEEDHESPITLTLEEEEKIQDDETPTEAAVVHTTESDEKKSTKEETKGEESSTQPETSKKEGGDSSSAPEGKKVPSNANPRAIWISNVAMNTRACDIKQALSQFGKVVGAKVVVNAKYPGTCCFGYVTMGSVEDAKKVIENLNNTELNGQIIKIERFDVVRNEQLKQIKNGKRSPDREHKGSKQTKKDDDEKADADAGGKESGNDTSEKKEDGTEKGRPEEKKRHSVGDRYSRNSNVSRDRSGGMGSRSSDKKNDILTFDKIREARERQRMREKERVLREEARRRHEETMRQKEIERRQRSEAQRLEREREKLRVEREKIEREKNELIRLERERQKLERERIELEKMELQRTRIRLEEDRRAVKRPAPYRREDSFNERKRSSDSRHFNEAPPPPHFDSSSNLRDSPSKKFPSKDYKSPYDKRDISDKRSREYDRPHSGAMGRPTSIKFDNRNSFEIRGRDIHERNRDVPPTVSSRITKDHRFERERDRSPHFRPSDRRVMPDDMQRFDSRNTGWNNSVSNNKWQPKEDSWRPNNSSDRWNNSRNQNFGNSGANMTAVCPPPPGINNYPDRFEYNKIPSSVHKY